MEQKDWIKILRDRLLEQKAEVPESLWKDIECSLDKRQRHARLVRLYSMTAAAVVAAMMIVGTGYYFNKDVIDGMTIAEQVVDKQEPVMTAERGLVEEGEVSPVYAVLQKNADVVTVFDKTVDAVDEVIENKEDKGDKDIFMSADKEALLPEKNDDNARVSKNDEHISASGQNHQNTDNNAVKPIDVDVNRNNGHFTVEAYSSNIISNGMGMQGVSNVRLMSDYAMTSNMLKSKPSDMMSHSDKKKHYLPMSFGLSVGYGLNERLSLSTGVVYTRAVSDFMNLSVADNQTVRQILHYIGIPLNVDYSVWSNPKLKVYATVGGQADINVVAEKKVSGTDYNIDRDKMQWSLDAAVGVEYDFIPKLGVYVEPGIKYYVDNGSNIDNVFKDKTCNFSLQIGLRYNIK